MVLSDVFNSFPLKGHCDMKNGIKISMLGGDLRQLYAAKKLAEVYGEPHVWGIEPPLDDRGGVKLCGSMEEALCGSSAVVLPLPRSEEHTSELQSR